MAMVLISLLEMCLGMFEIVFPLPEAVPTLESDALLKSHQYQTNKVNCMKVPKNQLTSFYQAIARNVRFFTMC